MITDRGCPLLWPLSMHHFHLLPKPLRFKAGAWPENWLILPGLVVATAWLGAQLAVAGGAG